MMSWLSRLVKICIFFLGTIVFSSSEIHRAKTHGGKSVQYQAEEITLTASDVTESHYAEDNGAKSGDVSGLDEASYFQVCVYSIAASMVVGTAGIFPLLLPIHEGHDLQNGADAARFKCLLSFAVGGLLGDVFLHLLPEAWDHVQPDDHFGHTKIGLWVVFGILSFLVLEKMFSDEGDEKQTKQDVEVVNGSKEQLASNGINSSTASLKTEKPSTISNGYGHHGNSKTNGSISKQRKGKNGMHLKNGLQKEKHLNGTSTKKNTDAKAKPKEEKIKVTGYLNLLANFIDNFTHGLAVAGSFMVSFKVGVLTTFAIMLHEIPHEIGDFAILLRSGFDRWKAAKAQVYTASGGVCGALVALMSESPEKAGDSAAWILPFTSGGFLNIALVTVLPDLLEETNPRESIKQVLCLLSGVAVMAAVNLIGE